MNDEEKRINGDSPAEAKGPLLPSNNQQSEKMSFRPPFLAIPPSFYVIFWISCSSTVIIFNKWILDTLAFPYPVVLTTYHLTTASVLTQILARCTPLLDGRKAVKMNTRLYMRAIMPIGVCFSVSLICGNLTYLYLSVAFIQMLKATTPVVVLLSSWFLGSRKPDTRVFLNVCLIVFGVLLASVGEIEFVWIGFLYQITALVFEALRLSLVDRLLSSAEYRMDPLVSLYYFAPICALFNFIVAMMWEIPKVTMDDIFRVGVGNLLLNGMSAFMLNVAAVFLIGKTSAVVLTLCGVLKDILLVVASMVIWNTQVTALQFFGYSLALMGIIYYRLGHDTVKGYVGEATRQWADFGARRPISRKISILLLSMFAFVSVLHGFAPSYTSSNAAKIVGEFNKSFGRS